ncbi:MAG: hypothetical protein KAT68_15675 [Bacteroidales bacterium]|nr:hypothetical protein [Bacteroidales bacterium]
MLEHQKIVLRNLYYDKIMFKKEINKSTKWLTNEELVLLYKWLKREFDTNYFTLISVHP